MLMFCYVYVQLIPTSSPKSAGYVADGADYYV